MFRILGLGILVILMVALPVVNATEEAYNQTYLDQWIKENGCNCTKHYMEEAARLIDSAK